MVKIDLPGINKITRRLASGDRAIYYYHRATGRRLEGAPGSPEFLASYQAAQERVRAADRNAGTVQAIIQAYRQSTAFTDLRASTQQDYLKQLAKIEDDFGDMPIAALRDEAVRGEFLDWRDRLARRSKKQADYAMTVLGRLIAWAIDRGRYGVSVNYAARPGKLYKANRADRIWLPAHEARFMAAAPVEMQRALILAADTGQRQGDLLRLTWSAYDGAFLRLKQSKGQRNVAVPVTTRLRRMLDAMPRGDAVTILTDARGRPWKASTFHDNWRSATLKAGLDGLRFNDLRGTAVTRLDEAGCTTGEIVAITGHTRKSAETILEAYAGRTTPIAVAAITKLEKRTAAAKRLQNTNPASSKGVR